MSTHRRDHGDEGRGPLILLAPDSFKESLTAAQVCEAMEAGFRAAIPSARFVHLPMADGGEGTTQSLVDATGGTLHTVTVTGPLGAQVEATYGILGDGETGVVEMAAASGLELLDPECRDACSTTSYGTGELILACLDQGVRRLVIGLGGSATNDGGAGMATALGARMLGEAGAPLAPGGAALADLARIVTDDLDPRLKDLRIDVACDVTNPLCGDEGASAVFGPQKGASPEQVTQLDLALAHFAEVVHRDLGHDVAEIPGAGAAGGLGAGLLAFTGAELKPGIDIVIDRTGLAQQVADADLVVTGEGRMDAQTRFGKTPFGVARVAVDAGKPVIGIAGSLGEGIDELEDVFDAIVPVLAGLAPLEEVLSAARGNIERTCRNVGRLVQLTL